MRTLFKRSLFNIESVTRLEIQLLIIVYLGTCTVTSFSRGFDYISVGLLFLCLFWDKSLEIRYLVSVLG